MKSMNLVHTLIFFCIPSCIIYFLYEIIPSMNIPLHWAVYLSTWGIIAVMSVVVLLLWRKSTLSFTEYFWVKKVSKRDVLILLGVFVGTLLLEQVLGGTRLFLMNFPGFAVPNHFPEIFKPTFELEMPLQEFMGMSVKGNYFIIHFWIMWLVINILGEEFLWRAFALPRMELYFGKWAWLINGLLWNIGIHFFMQWSFLTLLPVSVAVPYFSQKYRSWVPGLIIHGLGNGIFFLVLIPSIIQ